MTSIPCRRPAPIAPLAIRAAALLICLAGAVGCNTTGRPLPDMVSEINGTLHSGESILPGDVLEVFFTFESEWTHTTRVTEEGKATFNALDERDVGGLTVTQLDAILTEEYDKILERPELSVRVSTPSPRTASILGEVRAPGVYTVRPRYTLIDLLADSEGFLKRTADLDGLLLLRWLPDRQEVQSWYIDANPKFWTGAEPLYIQPLDIVYIPNKPIDKVNIWVDQYIRLMLPFPYLYLPAVPF